MKDLAAKALNCIIFVFQYFFRLFAIISFFMNIEEVYMSVECVSISDLSIFLLCYFRGFILFMNLFLYYFQIFRGKV